MSNQDLLNILGVGGATSATGLGRSLDFLLDVPLVVTVELGRRRMPIQELLQLGKGSVVELDKVAGEPLDLRVNDRLVARGEAVVVNDKFGVRLTQIMAENARLGSIV